MKTVTSIKATKTESPKTPGGISKSLLTPCRRVGLSRNWKKVGPSPFVSPLTTTNPTATEAKTEKKVTRKRKVRTPTEELDEPLSDSPKTPVENDGIADIDESYTPATSTETCEEIVTTPLRHVQTPRRKKSKTLLATVCKSDKIGATEEPLNNENITSDIPPSSISLELKETDQKNSSIITHGTIQQKNESVSVGQVSTPIRTKSKGKIRKALEPKAESLNTAQKEENTIEQVQTPVNKDTNEFTVPNNVEYEIKKKSPNDLTKECIVVIQKKIFKTDKKNEKLKKPHEKEKTVLQLPDKNNLKTIKDTITQTISDSDSDEVPLCQLNKKVLNTNIDEDDDFQDTIVPVKRLAHKHTSITGLKPAKKKPKTKANPQKSVESKSVEVNLSNSFDDDDFEMDKRTILIRKTYDKVTKPQKAKSTGSITQHDIDELRGRIEMKKKMLMAKAMTEDTEELRTLIKKWQKGCQDALMELMELMKDKFPEKENMDYAEMLQTLKIPALLVGYDEEHDCFTTPDDENIVLAKFKDL